MATWEKHYILNDKHGGTKKTPKLLKMYIVRVIQLI